MIHRTLIGLFLLLGFCLSHLQVLGQASFKPGYIIKTDGDSIPGFIDYSAKDGIHLLFKRSIEENAIEFSPESILKFGFNDGRLFKTLSITTEGEVSRYFLESLVKGVVNLYEFNDRYFIEEVGQYFIELVNSYSYKNDEGEEIFTKSFDYLNTLRRYVVGCPEIFDELILVQFAREDLIRYISANNECLTRGGSLLFDRTKEKIKTEIGLGVGYLTSSLSFASSKKDNEYLTESDIGYDNNLIYGIFLKVYSPRVSERFSLRLEANYLNQSFYGYFESEDENSTIRTDLLVDYALLTIPLSIQYDFSIRKRFVQYVAVGFSTNILLSPTSLVMNEIESDQVVFINETEICKYKTVQLGAVCSYGLKINIHPSIYPFLQCQIDYSGNFISKNLNETGEIKSRGFGGNIKVGLGYSF